MSPMSSDDRISAYADGQLSHQERAEIDALLESSEEARKELSDYQKLSHLLRDLPQESADDDLSRRVLAQAEQESLLGNRATVSAGAAAAATSPSISRRVILSTLATSAALMMGIFLFSNINEQARENAFTPNSSSESLTMLDEEAALGLEADAVLDAPVATAEGVSSPMVRSVKAPDRLSMEFGSSHLMKLSNPQNLKTASIGDTVEGWKFDEDRIVVVQLTVVDREQVLNSMHILLSDLSIPAEQQEDAKGATEGNGFYAVYVEADQDKMTAALKELQEDMNIEEMLVSAELPASGLNPYFAEQGYAMVDSDSETNGFALGGAAPEATETGEEAKTDSLKNTPRDSTAKPDRQLSGLVEKEPTKDKAPKQRAVALSPPPPPLPETSPATARSTERSLSYSARQVQLRLPAPVGNKMLAQTRGRGLPSLSNSAAMGRRVNQEALAEFQNDRNVKPLEAPAASMPGSKEKPRLARNQTARPVQILFLLTPEQTPAAPVP